VPQPVDWQAIAQPLDSAAITPSHHHIRRWIFYRTSRSGVLFDCRTASGQAVTFRVDIIQPDVIRLRLLSFPLTGTPGAQSEDRLLGRMQEEEVSDLLVQQDWPSQPFQVIEEANQLVLTTARLRLEFRRFPWQMRVYDIMVWDAWLEHSAARRRHSDGEVGEIGLFTRGARPSPFFRQRIDDRSYGPGYEVLPIGFQEGPDGQLTVREAVAVSSGESFYGFGEKFTPLDKWGQEIISWSVDTGGVSSHRSYKNVPFFMSSAGYGIFIHSSFPIIYRLGTESSTSYSFHVADSKLDYFLIYGPQFDHILRHYWDLAGWPSLPPKWSFGFWISRAGYRSRAEVEDVAREMRARDLPVDVISLDPWWMGEAPWSTYRWDEVAFPEPAEMITALREQGIRTCLWIHPWIPPGTDLYEEAMARGYLVQRADGGIAPVQEAFSGSGHGAIDFTNPEAVGWLEEKLQKLLDMGVAAFKTDFGEQAPVDAVYHDGRCGLEMHNLYPLLYNRTVWELTRRRFGRGLVWGRSGYAGSQRYPVQWGGDSYSSLDQMYSQLQGLLSYGMSGVPFCSHDIGGFDYSPSFFDDVESETFLDSFDPQHLLSYPKDVLVYIRWLQFGVFSSHMRAHGKQAREPWTYGPEAEAIARRYLKLRYRLLPYIYSQAVKSTRTGLPMVRPMVLAFQDNPTTSRIDHQYMFGEDFLVAPIFCEDDCCQVYLPGGGWVDYWSKELLTERLWMPYETSLEKLPLWVRAGAIIPMGPEMNYVDEKPVDPLTLEIYSPAETGETVICDEDRPSIAVRYRRQDDRLQVEVDAAPGQVEIILYGVTAQTAIRNSQMLLLQTVNGGQRVCFDGRQPSQVTFLL
jgi:alpha-D-xyloside xylohydrolase